ncbi:hypothetical protein M409DRAFT_18916 [Zasmidium cellare ATCC 36951]|uniref:Uncharacterized protein n=1 Tax=Zasmidium cellare ATCC 36951 TaxID=1080233 RepID=A0A6A6CV78_ZASCE|nr:uncharacterized protein M409DRAFT_18916 [Zasmidium cellare ATCC 36951]KAF2170945.1 hypothetical protein M409DRAFT_18916 [Zasmidium cellare ATCC 36951]
MARHSFKSLDLSLVEYAQHLEKRRLPSTVVVSSPIEATDPQTSQQWRFHISSILILQRLSSDAGHVEFRQQQGMTVYRASAADVISSAHPTADVLAQIYSGNNHICAITKSKLNATKAASPKPNLNDVELRVLEARAVHTQAYLMGVEGGIVSLSGGESFDAGKAISMDDFVVIRKTRQEEHAMVKKADLESFSSLFLDESNLPSLRDGEQDFVTSEPQIQELRLVIEDVYACGSRGRKVPLKKGDKVLAHARSTDATWLRDTRGRSCVLAASLASSHLLNLNVEDQAINRASRQTNSTLANTTEIPWTSHTAHNDQSATGGPQGLQSDPTHPTTQHPVSRFPRSRVGLPQPPSSWSPSEHRLSNGQSPFGNWEYASYFDREVAELLDVTSAARTVFAASMGRQGLGLIKISWVPGEVEGSQGAGFGVCSGYIHAYMINFRRKWAYDKPAVPFGELPVYTGSDEFWVEAKGANASYLDDFKTQGTPNALPTEPSLFAEARHRQGFAARQLPTPTDSLIPNPTSVAARQWQAVLLQASDRSVSIGQRLVNEHPIDGNQSYALRTSFHPQLTECGYQVKMPNGNYLLQDLPSVKDDVFAPGKKSLSVIQAGFPMLSADGEGTTTIVMVQTHQIFEVQLIDIPYLPKAIAADEDLSVLEAFHRFTKDWHQIGGRMNEQERIYTNAYNSEAWKIRHTYRLIDKQTLQNEQLNKDEKAHFRASVATRPITQAHRNMNTLRGCAPGKINPTLAENAVVQDPAGNQVSNWHEQSEKKILKNRSELVKTQAEAQNEDSQDDEESEDEDAEGEDEVRSLMNPAFPKTAVVPDVTGKNLINWVRYPACDWHPTERLRGQQGSLKKKDFAKRRYLIKCQAELPQGSTEEGYDSGDEKSGSGDEDEDEDMD